MTYGTATIVTRSDDGRSYEIDLDPFQGADIEWKLLFLMDHPTGEPVVVVATIPGTTCSGKVTISGDQLP